MSYTAELLSRGGFEIGYHLLLPEDVREYMADDPQSWPDIRDVLIRIKDARGRPRDWEAPLARRNADVGEIRVRGADGHYRLYVHAPRSHPNFLLLLHLGWKPGGEEGLNVQDGQIDEACARLVSWLTTAQ
ncbi:Uncharacterised protein [Mycobacteroides abscessus]|uniref:Uncharacterized protein n=2 Tax=Mycobacteroides abscessus TaxID=36809 RepID=A0A829HWV4_9MYCO|nr:hypothetical protein [Mycobacteroides abscessus]AIC71932.1 hypothetical protein MYCMA_07700 [Mycobacteroides abscessus subsp. massiliense str. GO 06]EHC00826.1 hypothetical protein MAB47J26_04905 [Mycobacteroides abscessus 47J26]EPQ23256.1 hypothetical protein J108_13540 [Mycobacteroides abscessus subsp. bolletii CRM-0020]AMU26745.1 hypothetical protein A3N96_16295 [Mycobacteroides abscessus]AMU36427.1 hypothetical protein A3N98_15485 [Mycobacteroides abscessus]